MRNRGSLLGTLALSLCAWPASAETGTESIEASSEHAAERPAVVYDKGFTLQTTDGDYALAIKGRLQSRYSYERADELDDSGVMERVGDGDLGVSRARLTLKGRATALTYKIQADFADGFELKDFFADYRPTSSPVRLRVGRFKRPSSRQHIGSSANLDLVDRSITHKTFKNLRDTGIDFTTATRSHRGSSGSWGSSARPRPEP